MLCRFGTAALPKCHFLHTCVKNITHHASKEILSKCRDTYISLSKKVEQDIQDRLYSIQQSTNFHQFECIRARHIRELRALSFKNNSRKKKKLSRLVKSNGQVRAFNTKNPDQSSHSPAKKKRRTRRFRRRPSHVEEDKQLVVNLSTHKLTEEQRSLLALGPKFCPTPKTFNHQAFTEDVKEGCRLTRLREYHLDRAESNTQQAPPKFYKKTWWSPQPGRDKALDAFCHIIQNRADAYTPTAMTHRSDNLTSKQRKALGELKSLVQNRRIRISAADKGGATVDQNTSDYIDEAMGQLSKSEHYMPLQHDPTKQIARKSNEIADDLLNKGHISEQTHKWARLNVSATRLHRFYTLPKIHKTLVKPPGRPIVSGVNGPTEKLSKLVDSWLQEHMSRLPSYVKDSTHMLETIEEWNRNLGPFPAHTKLVTIDVTALYTNIPHADLKTAILHHLTKDPRSDIPPPNVVVDVAEHVLSNNVFEFEGQIYKQVFGTAMGTPLAPSAASLFMGWLEEQLLEKSPVHLKTERETWKRFIDDIFMLWTSSEEDLDSFITFINNYHPSIKFTSASSESSIPFLDILISLQDGYLQTDLYSKPTDAHAYLHHTSCHPHHTVNNIPYSLFIRLRRLCSSEENFQVRCDELTDQLKKRGHRTKTIARARTKASSLSRSQCLQYKTNTRDSRVPFVVNYHPNNPPLRTWLHELHTTMTKTSDRMKRAVPKAPVVGERNTQSLRSILMPSTLAAQPDPRPPGCHKCDAARCTMCRDHLTASTSFSSQTTGEVFTHRHTFSCTSKNIIYLMWCVKCSASQYVGETKTSLKQRFYKHYADIRQNAGTYVTEHFSQHDHTLALMRCMPIEQVLSSPDDTQRRRQREFFWMTKLRTMYPLGLNAKE
jgi:hypothetical protein